MTSYELGSNFSGESLIAEDFLSNPEELLRTLAERGTLNFTPYASGLFSASDLAELTPEEAEATGMGMAWFRDNVHVANALYESGEVGLVGLAVNAGRAMLDILNNNRHILDGVVEGGYPPQDYAYRLPVRVQGDTLENDTEHRVQNDSVGYALWFTSRLIKDEALQPDDQDMETLAQTVRYLEKIEYWQDEDEGHWEEERAVHTSSIGVVVAGLKAAKEMFESRGGDPDLHIEELIHQGSEALRARLPREITQSGSRLPAEVTPDGPYPDERTRQALQGFDVGKHEPIDAALLFLVEPLHLLEGAQAAEVVSRVVQTLSRANGVARYPGDTYWMPRFTDILSREVRTKAAEGRTDDRNMKAAGVAYSGTEAQWTLFDPLLSAYWGERYKATADPTDRERQLLHLNRSLSQLISTADGRLLLPEAYYLNYEAEKHDNVWSPNEHMPLLWSQANLLLALKTFRDVAQNR